MKLLPIGIENFKELIDKNYYYVDKTNLIANIINEKVVLYTRPRRFGKTLNMSMLYYFFSIKEKDNAYLFDYLNISKNKDALKHQNKYPNQLSGGQQQRTAIGRALAKNPSLLLCDEPTGALDYKTSKDILELLEKINEKYKTTIIVVTHNDAIKNMAHRVMRLRDGQIIKNKINETRTKAEDLEW